MANKRGAKPIWMDGEIYFNFRRAVAAEGWRFGLTGKAEELLKAYAIGVFKEAGLKWENPKIATESPSGAASHSEVRVLARYRVRHAARKPDQDQKSA